MTASFFATQRWKCRANSSDPSRRNPRSPHPSRKERPTDEPLFGRGYAAASTLLFLRFAVLHFVRRVRAVSDFVLSVSERGEMGWPDEAGLRRVQQLPHAVHRSGVLSRALEHA